MSTNKITLIAVILILTVIACAGGKKITSKGGSPGCVDDPKLTALVNELKQVNQRISVLFGAMFSFESGSSRRKEIEDEYEILRQRHKHILDEIIGNGQTVIPCMIELVKDDSIQIRDRVDGVIVLGEVSRDRNDEMVILTLIQKLPYTERTDTLAVMTALLNIGKPAIPYVIAQLNNESMDKRIWAIELLKIMTTQTFDFYDPKNSDGTMRQQAVDKIREWWKENELMWKRPRSKD